ncbi:hypothetical protein DQ353_06420 [Arthrobacter sp. AQ5-05]|nr:hypothetical protein DQ353_06420 [Arthrobacter sp. AQ5-05]
MLRRPEAKATDDALGLFAVTVETSPVGPARRSSCKRRQFTLPQPRKASRIVAGAAKVAFRELESIGEVRT